MDIKKIFNVELQRFSFWRSFILNSHLFNLHEKFSEGPEPFKSAKAQVYENIIRTLSAILDTFLLPTLAAYLNVKKSTSKNITVEDNYFYKELFSKNYQDILKEIEAFHTPTVENIFQRCNKFRYHFNKTCDRIFNDWSDIKKLFNINDEDVLDFTRFFIGDEHGLGAQTTLISFNEGKKGFVYKPVDIKIDILVHGLIAYIYSEFSEKYSSTLKFHPVNKNNEQYGYIELVAYSGNLKNTQEAETIYYNYGKLLALGHVLKLSDGHADNIIVNYPNVHWLDMETAFHFTNSDISDIVHPLSMTGLIFEVRKTNCNFGLVTGLQGGTIPRLNLTQPTAMNDGKDDLYIRYFKLSELDDKKNRIYINNILCCPEDYQLKIVDGFKTMYKNLLMHKDKILRFLHHQLGSQTIYARQVLYSTTCYSRYIYLTHHFMATTAVDCLRKIREERENWILEADKPFSEFIINNELIDICNGVIPYFYRTNHSRALYHISGVSVPNYFKQNLYKDLEDHVLSLSEDVMEEYGNYIITALASTKDISSWEDFQKKFEYEVFDYEKNKEEQQITD